MTVAYRLAQTFLENFISVPFTLVTLRPKLAAMDMPSLPQTWFQGVMGIFAGLSYDDKCHCIALGPEDELAKLDTEGVAYLMEVDIIDRQLEPVHNRLTYTTTIRDNRFILIDVLENAASILSILASVSHQYF